jgi:hypothetical protein
MMPLLKSFADCGGGGGAVIFTFDFNIFSFNVKHHMLGYIQQSSQLQLFKKQNTAKKSQDLSYGPDIAE